ncbi:MAG TPA: ribosome biogenesis GTPase Der [Candidatus Limnocylindria bacterium]|jgi:GTP-binding protein|nr:ribosome biogenesis GTPase Der [Candidatus Limnocylindria bacterium]
MTGLIAIVGRPNVGKSALFNRIIRKRIAIVHDMPGVTRDRVTAEAEWHGRPFTLVDTGGIGLLRGERSEDVIVSAAFDQVQIAIDSANLIILVVNVQDGVVPLDAEVAKRLHASGKPVIVAVNKVDTYKAERGLDEFAELGFSKVYPVSAIHGEGLNELMDDAIRYIPKGEPVPVPEETYGEPVKKLTAQEKAKRRDAERSNAPVKIAIVGRPNVGKSSLINKLTGSERVIVSPIPGTTRDAVDVPFEVDTEGVRQQYILIDTAGVRKARRIDDTVELFSVERTKEAIARCDIAVLVLDAESGILEQDKKVAAIITENRRGCIVVVNKWDLVAADVREAREKAIAEREAKIRNRDNRDNQRPTMLAEFGEWVQEKLFFLDYAPVIFTSAKDGFQLERLLESVRYVAAQLKQKVPTAILNRTLQDAIIRKQPVSSMGHHLKFYYATQVRQAPPTFLLFVNRDEVFNVGYDKYLSGELRKAFGFEGCPLVLVPKARPKTIEPKRKYNKEEEAPVAGAPRTLKSLAKAKGRSQHPAFRDGKRPPTPVRTADAKPAPGGRRTAAGAAPRNAFVKRGKPGAPTRPLGRDGRPTQNKLKKKMRGGRPLGSKVKRNRD